MQTMMVAMLAGSALAQISTVPAYITSSKYMSYPSLSSASLQSMLARQLYAGSSASPRRVSPAPTSSPSRYAASAASNPSIVAIPLYVRNQAAAQKSAALYDILSNPEKKASSKYATHLPKKAYGESAPYRSESVTRYEKPVYTYAKYDQPKAAPSSYEPVRSYELKNSEPGYGDASSVSLLSSGYGQQQGSISIAYPPASYKQTGSQSTSRPQLKAVEYDDSQKSALSDFAAALENFDLKSISSQDIYDLPPVNPPLTRLSASKKQPAEESYAAPSPYSKSQSYDSPKQSYSPASASYDDSRTTYAAQSPLAPAHQSYAAPETYSSYAASAPSADAYRPAADSYRSQAAQSRDEQHIQNDRLAMRIALPDPTHTELRPLLFPPPAATTPHHSGLVRKFTPVARRWRGTDQPAVTTTLRRRRPCVPIPTTRTARTKIKPLPQNTHQSLPVTRGNFQLLNR